MSIVEELPEDVQQRMIEKLLGKVNAERIKSAAKGFRPTPVIVAYEYYQLPKQLFRNWRIDRIENGRKDQHLANLDKEACLIEVKPFAERVSPSSRWRSVSSLRRLNASKPASPARTDGTPSWTN
ncbi:hypothetical protein PMI09_02457 [Rhizobium sp. CF122]|uniref:hypothetical protein n=1 Tax=Rhizobium sp. CF122 TaxID=1144312 RepID=UPI0002717DB1|nr:hypothetical protein [Rhizobium sp. CF122]EJL54366.1 hypothetical protein PMI09_02457 [Rhizobium sp. CF122]